MVSRGTLDWGRPVINTTFGLDDLGEHAVRTGSIVSFDRRGRVLWLDGFENGVHMWILVAAGAGSSVAISTAEARNGAQSVLLTGGSDLGRFASIDHSQAKPAGDRFGMEMSWLMVGALEEIVMRMVVFDGTNETEFSIRWRFATDDLSFLNSSGAFVIFATSVIVNAIETFFQTFKLVADAGQNLYVRFIVNDTEYDLSANAGNRDTNTFSPHLAISMEIVSRAGQNDQIHVDDAIITHNEP